jgi:hypothetical protein
MRRSRAESIMRVCQIVQRKIAHGEHGLNRFGTDILKKEIGDNPLNLSHRCSIFQENTEHTD